ncbi:MAG: NAD(P)/FAD-dependent oxidoreductase [Ignavibacteriaceae bacterium]
MKFDSIIIGAGQGGLGTSYFLQQKGIKHTVFERGRIGESWLSMRWDSFKLNTPNFMNVLPDYPYDGVEPDGFWGVRELIEYFHRYVDQFQLPVRTGTTVNSVEQSEVDECFIVKTKSDGQIQESITCRTVVIASGILQVPKIPLINNKIPETVISMHSAEYHNASELQPGAVVVVGSGQTGCQIAEDLISAGKDVYLCTSKVGRAPRRYRGKDILEWWVDMKFFDVKFDSLEDKSVARMVQPQISGTGRYGHTVSLQYLANKGAVILGRLSDVEENTLIISNESAEHVHFADDFSQKIKNDIDTYILQSDITIPPHEDDPADIPDDQARCSSNLRKINVQEANIGTIIWATGFKGNFSWLNLPVIDADGKPIHQRGISPVRGLYFIGFPWLSSRKSGIIYGIKL